MVNQLDADEQALADVVTAAVAGITQLEAEVAALSVGTPVTQAQLDAITNATAALKASVAGIPAPPAPAA